MTTPALGAVDSVRRIVGSSSDEVDDQTCLDFLGEADRTIRSMHFNDYMADLFFATMTFANGQVNTSYKLYFPIKAGTTPVVEINGITRTVNTDYTFSGSTMTVLFSMCAGDKIMVFYIPEFFDDYANYLAADAILSRMILDTNNQVFIQNSQYAKTKVLAFQKLIAAKPHIARAVDHAKDFNLW